MIQAFDLESAGRKSQADHILIASILLLTGVGLVTLYSASYAYGERFFGEGLYFITRQLLYGFVGLGAFFVASWINLEYLRKLIVPMVVITAVLCLLTFMPGIGVTKNGAARWIRIGSTNTFQPSELVKLTLPFYLAHIFSKKQERINSLIAGILPPTLITLLFFFLIYLQNNFSTALFIAINAVFIFFLAGVRYRYFISGAVILIPLSAFLVLTKEHRLRRVISFFIPDWEPLGAGYQVHSSLLSIGSGGLLGKGFGQGTRKIASVPEIHSDFIFSSFSEEAGLAGVFLFFLIFMVFAIHGYRAAIKSNDMFRRLLGFGLVTMISSQALLNIAVVSGAVPATGVPLPFFSAGGSSLAITLLIAGLIVNISRNREVDHV
ncbi:putative lipid II flippase FtsW [Treponema primitia]|uniref:putative lipid II flippase FtsW n=1 Tax=Treponema primitia TaxID=88058 RepID=UPI0002555343|nr:putative lipid II flippase FtsW [Treponema primitia]